MTIGDRLREERISTGFNQEAFGLIGGVTGKTQGYYERGSRHPDTAYLERVSKTIDVNYVITGQRLISSRACSEADASREIIELLREIKYELNEQLLNQIIIKNLLREIND